VSSFQAQRVRDALDKIDGSDEQNAALEHVLQYLPWHEAEIAMAGWESDLRSAVDQALIKFTGTMH
jgi:hypothetical protein